MRHTKRRTSGPDRHGITVLALALLILAAIVAAVVLTRTLAH